MDFNLVNIKPCDNTFFGDGNQFNFDISNLIKSKNTPYPSVFFGAIFTAILTHNDKFRKAFFQNGRYDHESILKIGQIYLFNEESKSVYIKAPMDLFANSKSEISFGKFKNNAGNLNSLSYEYILEIPAGMDYKRIENMYINIKNIHDSYSKKQGIRVELKDENQLFVKNHKIGIGINKNTKKTEEGKLYQIEQTEFIDNNWSYIVEYKINKDYLKNSIYKEIEVKNLDKGYLKLGGENKPCKFKTIYNDKIERFNSKKTGNLNSGIYKILFTSETYFPKGIDSFFKKNNIRILGVSNDKPIYIGGYDMQGKGTIRKMYKGYSAGTVILVEFNNNSNTKDIYELLKNDSVKGFNNCVILKEDF
ncbi:type III-B CRISPR module-associated Cmr3 family protein [Clostridium amazonitimonense]|uniref:type III-B CRISPR module-associated Cmr3 family protein n=1 Tax=Clostridium amazonitimonense TaxID=1499689 RepID=UPI000509CD14|nr:type III-B CRISPR module-associated Cmr3 family protein [Clostridium amazonitimonense]